MLQSSLPKTSGYTKKCHISQEACAIKNEQTHNAQPNGPPSPSPSYITQKSEIASEAKPLLHRLSTVETFPETSSQAKASTLGGAKPCQSSLEGTLTSGKPYNTL